MNITVSTNHDLQGSGAHMDGITALDLARRSASRRQVIPVRLMQSLSTPMARGATTSSVPLTG